MKLLSGRWLLWLCMMVSGGLFGQEGETGFKRSGFYSALAGKDAKEIDRQLHLLKTATVTAKDGFAGALLMKKAGLVQGPKKKLELFKQGHKKLEAVLQKDSSNTELRLLRLMIQEQAPGILGYKAEQARDAIFIRDNFKKLPQQAQAAAIDYGKGSKVLQLDNL